MAVQLSSSYLRRGFQLLAMLDSTESSNDEAFDKASDLIFGWSQKKFFRVFRNMPSKKETFEDKLNGNEIGFIYNQEEGQFIFRCSHPDSSVPGRMWITDVQLSRQGFDYVLAVRLSVTSLQSCTDEVPFSCPGFVYQIINNVGLSDIYQISRQVNILTTKEEVDSFISFLENSNRKMPAVLLTPITYEDRFGQYTMNAEQMAFDLSGVAHVFKISSEANEYYTNKVGKPWTAFNGSVRTYYPNLSFEESDYYQHPMLTQKSIYLRNMYNEGDAGFCMREIEEYIRKYVLAQKIEWEANNIHFYLSSYQDLLKEQRNKSKQSRSDLIRSYEEQLDQLQKQSEENLALADSYAKDYETYREENDQQRQLIGQLKAQISMLRYQLKEATGADVEQRIPETGSLNEIRDWISEYYPDRLFLHPRAERSLKSALYEDTALIYKCLKLLASKYYDYRMGEIGYDTFKNECKAIDPGLDEAASITDTAAGMQGDIYYVQFHGKKRKLDRHLTKGNSRDRRYCLRIYFFWDDEEQIIVIGDLPHHLDTTAT